MPNKRMQAPAFRRRLILDVRPKNEHLDAVSETEIKDTINAA